MARVTVLLGGQDTAGGNGDLGGARGPRPLLVLVAANGRRVVPARQAPVAAEHSQSERVLIRLLASGHTDHELAALFDVPVRVAEALRAETMGRLRVSSRAELVRYAVERGVLTRASTNGTCASPPSA